MQRAIVIIAAAGLAATATAQDETLIAVEDAPANVVETALATAPGATFDAVSVENEDGDVVYEFRGTDYAGRRIEVDVLEDGALQEVEMQIAMSDVPDIVVVALEETAPDFTPLYVELSVRKAGELVVYEFQGGADNPAIYIEITEDGEVIVQGEDAQG